MILADSNVLLDIIQQDPVWAPWSTAALEKALLQEEERLALLGHYQVKFGHGEDH